MESYNECNNVDINVQEDKNTKRRGKISDDAPLLDTFQRNINNRYMNISIKIFKL